MNGLEFCHRIKTDMQTSHIPVIMLTAKNAATDQMDCYNAGADSYIAKPFETKVLLARIDNLLQAKEQYRQKFRSNMDIKLSAMDFQSPDEQFINNAIRCVENAKLLQDALHWTLLEISN